MKPFITIFMILFHKSKGKYWQRNEKKTKHQLQTPFIAYSGFRIKNKLYHEIEQPFLYKVFIYQNDVKLQIIALF